MLGKMQKTLFTYFSTDKHINKGESSKPVNTKHEPVNTKKSRQATIEDAVKKMSKVKLNDKEIKTTHKKKEVDTTDIDSDDSPEEPVVTTKKRRRFKQRFIEDDSSESSIDGYQRQKKKKKRQIIVKIENSEDIIEERTRVGKVSQYSQALKKLKDRKSKLSSYKGMKGPMDRYQANRGTDDESDNQSMDEVEVDDDFVVDDDIIDGVRCTVGSNRIEMPGK
ncbi:hypothetical protein BDB01DRAFT_51766 [Pilobolus umbonatus]|nr:hypothetical protein BDB01DRAFT_51766 [Pilobolus umbonatus]